jgi:hypothetical protein
MTDLAGLYRLKILSRGTGRDRPDLCGFKLEQREGDGYGEPVLEE